LSTLDFGDDVRSTVVTVMSAAQGVRKIKDACGNNAKKLPFVLINISHHKEDAIFRFSAEFCENRDNSHISCALAMKTT